MSYLPLTKFKSDTSIRSVLRPYGRAMGINMLKYEEAFHNSDVQVTSNIAYSGRKKPQWNCCEHTYVSKVLPIMPNSTALTTIILREIDDMGHWPQYVDRYIVEDGRTEDVRSFTSMGATDITFGMDYNSVEEAFQQAAIHLQTLPIHQMMNIPQAILELKDLPRTLSAIKNLGGWLAGKGKGFLGDMMHSKLGTVAGYYLADIFGINPTVGDVKKFIGQVPKRARIGVRQVKYAKGQTVRASCKLHPPDWDAGKWLRATCSAQFDGTGRRRLGREGTFGVSPYQMVGGNSTSFEHSSASDVDSISWPWLAAYKLHVVTLKGSVFARVRDDYSEEFSTMDDISINADPWGTAWELTPFSFVCDWFADLGNWLKNENLMHEARMRGFYLEDGIWSNEKIVTEHYLPALAQFLNQEVLIGDHPRPGASYAYYSMHATSKKVVTQQLVQQDVSYTRDLRYPESFRFAPLKTKGLGAQGTFQWAAGTALAIQQCDGLLKSMRL